MDLCTSSLRCAPRAGLVAALFTMTLSFPHCGIAATTVTIVDGSGTVLSAGRAYRAAPGVWLPGCAAVRAGRQAVLQVEFDDGSSIALGGEGSSVVVDVPAAQGASMTQVLVSGWAKLTVSERTRTAQRHVTMPMFEVQLIRGSAVMHADDRTNELFVESGSAIVRSRPASRDDHVTVAAGHTLSRVAGASGHRMGNRPTKSFLEAMPRAFRDTLPLLRKSFLERKAELVLAPGDAPQDKLLVAALLELRTARPTRPCDVRSRCSCAWAWRSVRRTASLVRALWGHCGSSSRSTRSSLPASWMTRRCARWTASISAPLGASLGIADASTRRGREQPAGQHHEQHQRQREQLQHAIGVRVCGPWTPGAA